MTATRSVFVAGSTFGQMYLHALQNVPGTRASGLLARGGRRSQELAARFGIEMLTSPDAVPDSTDLVCIAVRAGGVGGAGTQLATALLERGIPVLHELPMGSEDVAACLRAARRGGTAFAVADLYRWLPSVRAFRAAAHQLLAQETAIAVDAHLSIQPAYALARLLGDIGIAVRPTALQARDGGSLVSGTLGTTPLAVRYATVLDTQDTDNDVRFPSVSVHTRSGTLTLADVHGPVLWTPTLHLTREAKTDASVTATQLGDTRVSVPLHSSTLTTAEVLGSLWPKALARQIAVMLQGPSPADAQRSVQTARLWEELIGGVDFPAADAPADARHRAALQDRLLAAARAAVEPEGPTAADDPSS